MSTRDVEGIEVGAAVAAIVDADAVADASTFCLAPSNKSAAESFKACASPAIVVCATSARNPFTSLIELFPCTTTVLEDAIVYSLGVNQAANVPAASSPSLHCGKLKKQRLLQ